MKLSDVILRMDDIFFTAKKIDLINLTSPNDGHKSPASYKGITPISRILVMLAAIMLVVEYRVDHSVVKFWLYSKSLPGPGEKRSPLSHNPVHSAIEVDGCERS
jgi:hypothetical protein